MTALFRAMKGFNLATISDVYHMINFNIFFIAGLLPLWSEIGYIEFLYRELFKCVPQNVVLGLIS